MNWIIHVVIAFAISISGLIASALIYRLLNHIF